MNNKSITLNIIKKLLSKKYEKCADYITALKTKVNFKRVKKHIDKLNNNKIYKPIKILFDGENFAVKNDIEKLLASIISNKNITKRICFTKSKISSNNNLNKFIADFN